MRGAKGTWIDAPYSAEVFWLIHDDDAVGLAAEFGAGARGADGHGEDNASTFELRSATIAARAFEPVASPSSTRFTVLPRTLGAGGRRS